MPSISDLTDFAVHAVQLAGAEILKYFRSAPVIHNKADAGRFDPVTIADRLGEELIRREIQRAFPEHGICGEEGGTSVGSSSYTWYIDPIDGTRAFILGQLHWGTLLGCNDGVRPLIGVMHQPYVGETFVGSPSGARLSRGGVVQQLRTHQRTQLEHAFLCATDPTMFADAQLQQAFANLAARCRAVRWGGDCYTPCLLAAGHADLVVEAGLKPWDIQPLIPIIEAAGGIVTDWSGGSAVHSDQALIAANASLHAQALAALRGLG
jgi:histidinol phosphatase-like enzyme (inositol monophosphatase family)